MASNTGKWKTYQDGNRLYGPSGTGQNLNEDLQGNIANEVDAVLAELLSAGAVASGLDVSPGAGLSVSIAAGVVYVDGQRIKTTAPSTVSSLTPNATGLKIYVTAVAPFVTAQRAWTASFGFKAGSLAAGEYLLAEVNTNGSTVTLVTDRRTLFEQAINIPTASQKAALAGSAGTPGSGNKYVTQQDTLLPSANEKAAMAGTSGTPGDGNRYVTGADPKLPSADEKAAMAGTSGTPGDGNRYVTNSDSRMSNARTPTAHASTHHSAGSDPIDHGSVAGLGDDDHTLYHKVGETRRVYLPAVRGDATSPPGQALVGITPVAVFAGGAGTNQVAYVAVPLPAEFQVTTESRIYARIAMSQANAGTVRLAGSYQMRAAGQSLTASPTTWGTTINPPDDSNPNLVSREVVLTLAANTFTTATDMLVFSLSRDRGHAGNTHPGDLYLVTLEWEYVTKRG